MRTLVISDLHLGSRIGRDVLRRPAALDRLCAALEEADRLVLLGDIFHFWVGHEKYETAEIAALIAAQAAFMIRRAVSLFRYSQMSAATRAVRSIGWLNSRVIVGSSST